jgi:hypothetical protein
VPQLRLHASAQGKNVRVERTPQAVDDTPDDKAQMNFTDTELKTMQPNKQSWD